MEDKFKLKNINIEFEDSCENVIINFDDGEFIKIKNTEFTTEIENDYNDHEYKILNFATNCGLNLQQIELRKNWTFYSSNYYAISLNLDKLDANIEISSGLLSTLQQIDEKIKLIRLHNEKEEAERKRQAEGELAIEFDKNAEQLTNYVNFLKKHNFIKEINYIFNFLKNDQLRYFDGSFNCIYHSEIKNKKLRDICRQSLLNKIVETAKFRGFNINLKVRRSDLNNIFKIDLQEYAKLFFTYKFSAKLVGEQHNQHWVVESFEIIEKTKNGGQNV